MKTKNVTLAIAAFTFAIGGAVASSLFINEPVFIKAQLVAGGQFVCYDSEVECNQGGTNACTVTIPMRDGSTVVATTTPAAGQIGAYRSGCLQTLGVNQAENKGTAPLTGNERPIAVQQ